MQLINKQQKIVLLYRIINISAEDNILNYGKIWIKDKGQTVMLHYVENSKNEMSKLVEYWENSKVENIRNELI